MAEVKIQRDIFQGISHSPLRIISAKLPLSYIFRKCAVGYKVTKSQERIIYLDDSNVCICKKMKKNLRPLYKEYEFTENI